MSLKYIREMYMQTEIFGMIDLLSKFFFYIKLDKMVFLIGMHNGQRSNKYLQSTSPSKLIRIL